MILSKLVGLIVLGTISMALVIDAADYAAKWLRSRK